MQVEVCLILASVLIGLGFFGLLEHKNLVSILAALQSCVMGLLLALVILGQIGPHGSLSHRDSLLFGFGLIIFFSISLIVSFGVVFRRFKESRTFKVSENNHLRH